MDREKPNAFDTTFRKEVKVNAKLALETLRESRDSSSEEALLKMIEGIETGEDVEKLLYRYLGTFQVAEWLMLRLWYEYGEDPFKLIRWMIKNVPDLHTYPERLISEVSFPLEEGEEY